MPRRPPGATAARVRLLGPMLVTAAVSAMPPMAAAQQRDVAAALAEAEAAFEDEDAAAAERGFAAVLALDPAQPRALYRLAQLRRDDPAAATVLLQRYVEVVPDDAWGHLALAEAFARSGHADAALRAYTVAVVHAPDEPDVQLGRPRILVRLGHLDAAIAAFERWLSDHPGDSEVWRELAAARQRAGRFGGAADALERARQLPAEDAGLDARIDALRARVAPALEVGVIGSRETGATGGGGSFGADFPGGDGARVGVWYQRKRVSSFGDVAQAHRIGVRLTARPRAGIQLNAGGGTAWPVFEQRPGPVARQPEFMFRFRRTGPREGVIVTATVHRHAIDVTPELMRAPVVRTQAATSIDAPAGGPWRIRGLLRTARLARDQERNHRTALAGGAAFTAAPGIRLAGQWHQTRNTNPAVQSYFAPREAQLADAGIEFERDYDRVSVAFDAGGGIQRFRRSEGLTMGPWGAALRVWGFISWDVARRQQLLIEVESYDSQVADAVILTDRWRYASVTASLRLALR